MPSSRSRAVAPGQTPPAWLAALPPERARELRRVRQVIRRHLPPGYREVVQGGVLAYVVPLSRYPDTYNGHALWYAALAAPRSYLTLHLMGVYASPGLRRRLAEGFRAAGKHLRMGKACLRFTQADDLALNAVGDVVAALPVETMIGLARAARRH